MRLPVLLVAALWAAAPTPSWAALEALVVDRDATEASRARLDGDTGVLTPVAGSEQAECCRSTGPVAALDPGTLTLWHATPGATFDDPWRLEAHDLGAGGPPAVASVPAGIGIMALVWDAVGTRLLAVTATVDPGADDAARQRLGLAVVTAAGGVVTLEELSSAACCTIRPGIAALSPDGARVHVVGRDASGASAPLDADWTLIGLSTQPGGVPTAATLAAPPDYLAYRDDGVLLASIGSAGEQRLATLDPATGTATALGAARTDCCVLRAGVGAVEDGRVYLVGRDVAGTGSQLLRFDALTGAPGVDVPLDDAFAIAALIARSSAPIALLGTLTLDEDTPTPGLLTGTDPDGPVTGFEIVAPPALGTVELTDPATGAYVYTPLPETSGSDSFTFRVTDGDAFSAPAAVAVTIVPIDDPPQAASGVLAVTEDQTASGQLVGSDVDSAPLTFEIVQQGTLGVVTLTDPASGAFDYAPGADQTGADAFTFRVGDGNSVSATATISVTIAPVNDGPQAQPGVLALLEDTPAEGTFVAIDPDDAALTFTLADPASLGDVSILDPATGAYRYTPLADRFGADSFRFRAADGGDASAPATIAVDVLPVNDPPRLSPLANPTHPAGTSGPQTVPGFAAAVDPGPFEAQQGILAFTVDPVSDAYGVVPAIAIAPDGSLSYTLSGASGSAVFDVRARDDGGTDSGGVDLSAPRRFAIVVGDGADLELTLGNGVDAVTPEQALAYTIRLRNRGPGDVPRATLNVFPGEALADVSWACVATVGSCMPAVGQGALFLQVALPVDTEATVALSATVAEPPLGGGFAVLHGAATTGGTPPAVDPADDVAVDADPIGGDGVFRDGFENP